MRGGKKRSGGALKPARKAIRKGGRSRTGGAVVKAKAAKGKHTGKPARRTASGRPEPAVRRVSPKEVTKRAAKTARKTAPKTARRRASETKGPLKRPRAAAAETRTVGASRAAKVRPSGPAVNREGEGFQSLTRAAPPPATRPDARIADRAAGPATATEGSTNQADAPPLPVPIASFTI